MLCRVLASACDVSLSAVMAELTSVAERVDRLLKYWSRTSGVVADRFSSSLRIANANACPWVTERLGG